MLRGCRICSALPEYCMMTLSKLSRASTFPKAVAGLEMPKGYSRKMSGAKTIRRTITVLVWTVWACFAGLMTTHAPALAADQIAVLLDRAQLFKMPENAKTLVIGNPIIADVSIIKNGLMVVTGKSYGLTNVIALDAQGRQISDTLIQVRAPTEQMLTVQRGMEAETYHCAPTCSPTLMLGDADKYFGQVGAQATKHSGFAAPTGGKPQ